MDINSAELGNELCAAALAGNLVRARHLLDAGARIDHTFIGDECLRGEMHEHLCWPGNTPLAEAIRVGDASMIRFLVDAGADPNAPVAAAFGTYPERIKDRPLTWWMRFALEYQIDGDDGDSKSVIKPGMEEAGWMLLVVGADPAKGAITHEGGEGPGMEAMMIREGLGQDLDRMLAAASQNHLNAATSMADDGEKAIDRL